MLAIAFLLQPAFLAPPTRPRAIHAAPRRAATATMETVDSQALTLLGGALARISDEDQGGGGPEWQRLEGGAWLRLPTSTPWAVVHFVGGAALGAAPQLCYDTLLTDVCERASVAVIATPYEVGPDHSRLAEAVRESFDVARQGACDLGLLPALAGAPTFRVGHSLGAKLLVIGACGDGAAEERARLGLLAFNNFGVADSVKLAASVVQQMQGGGAQGAQTANAIADAFAFAQSFGSASGVNLEFSPSPQELQELVAASYAAADTRLIRFDADDLDCSTQLLSALPASAAAERVELSGAHLAPAALQLSLAEIEPTLAALLGARDFTLGDGEAVQATADALVAWLWPAGMAPPPTRALRASDVAAGEGEVVDV